MSPTQTPPLHAHPPYCMLSSIQLLTSFLEWNIVGWCNLHVDPFLSGRDPTRLLSKRKAMVESLHVSIQGGHLAWTFFYVSRIDRLKSCKFNFNLIWRIGVIWSPFEAPRRSPRLEQWRKVFFNVGVIHLQVSIILSSLGSTLKQTPLKNGIQVRCEIIMLQSMNFGHL